MHPFVSICFCILITACSANDSQSPDNNDYVSTPPFSNNTFSVRLLNSDNIRFENGVLIYRLFGFDRLLADVDATLIVDELATLEEFPGQTKLTWPDAPAEAISPPVSSAEAARYYIVLYVDRDMDGQLCNGDLSQDYSRTDFFTINERPTKTVDYYLTEINNPDLRCEGY